jgi:hypothetical protein
MMSQGSMPLGAQVVPTGRGRPKVGRVLQVHICRDTTIYEVKWNYDVISFHAEHEIREVFLEIDEQPHVGGAIARSSNGGGGGAIARSSNGGGGGAIARSSNGGGGDAIARSSNGGGGTKRGRSSDTLSDEVSSDYEIEYASAADEVDAFANLTISPTQNPNSLGIVIVDGLQWKSVDGITTDSENVYHAAPMALWEKIGIDASSPATMNIKNCFELMFPTHHIETILRLTSDNISKDRNKTDGPLTKGEFYKYIGIGLSIAREGGSGPIGRFWTRTPKKRALNFLDTMGRALECQGIDLLALKGTFNWENLNRTINGGL